MGSRPASHGVSTRGSWGLDPRVMGSRPAGHGVSTHESWGLDSRVMGSRLASHGVSTRYTQLSRSNPGTRSKCSALFVTSVRSNAIAWAAISVSSSPIGEPRSAKPLAGKRDGADADLRGPMLQNSRGYAALTSQREADAVGVRHELWLHANGSFFFETGLDRGRSISSSQVPSALTKSLLHSSADSRMTRFPTRRTRTSC